MLLTSNSTCLSGKIDRCRGIGRFREKYPVAIAALLATGGRVRGAYCRMVSLEADQTRPEKWQKTGAYGPYVDEHFARCRFRRTARARYRPCAPARRHRAG